MTKLFLFLTSSLILLGENNPLTVGETLSYRASFRGINAAEASLKVIEKTVIKNDSAYHVRFLAKSKGPIHHLFPINDEIKEIKNAIIKYEISTVENPLNTPKIISYALESNIKGMLIKKDNMTDFLIPDPSNKDIPIIIPDLDIPGNMANDWNSEAKIIT